MVNMFRKRVFSVYDDFKTGIFCKLSIFLATALLIFYFILKASVFYIAENSTGIIKEIRVFSQTSQAEAFAAFALLFFALGAILLFFKHQFCKLARIAEEVENSDEYKEIEN